MIPASTTFDQSTMSAMLDWDPVVAEYRTFFSFFAWSLVEDWQAQRSGPGRPGHPESAYLKAFLIRQHEHFTYTSQLRRFLLKHPLLVIELGFHLVLDPSAPYGFDVHKTLPCRYWLTEKLRLLDPDLLQALLQATVVALQHEIPGLGEVAAFDVKHIYAWVKENNPRVYVTDRYDKDQVLSGDPDCKLGVKRSSNRETSDAPDQLEQPSAAPATPTSTQQGKQHTPSPEAARTPQPHTQDQKKKKEEKEYLWGYGSGVAAATDPVYGDVVLAEYTLPFNEADLTYFRPLLRRAVLTTDRYPMHLAADAAFDCWYIYSCCAPGGIVAVPLRKVTKTRFDPDGTPLCARGLRMHPTYPFQHTNGYRAQRYRCPFLFPQRTGDTCDHAQFAKGKGCVKDINIEPGGLRRVLLDRSSPQYHAVYTQRTACERINSQSQALGIERPKVRNMRSVRNLNTLIYLVMNVHALEKAKSINAGLLSFPQGVR
jgi:hypothetical protein